VRQRRGPYGKGLDLVNRSALSLSEEPGSSDMSF
jgi:hypothetical protein